jgi:hypothetical protein
MRVNRNLVLLAAAGALSLVGLLVGLASNLATAEQRWPGWLDILRTHPWESLGTLMALVAALTVLVAQLPSDGAKPEPTDPLGKRVDLLKQDLDRSIALLPELQAELELKSAALGRLQADAEHYEQLVDVNRKQAEAIEQLVGRVVESGLVASGRINRRQQIIYFSLGIVASLPLNITGSFLYAMLTRK